MYFQSAHWTERGMVKSWDTVEFDVNKIPYWLGGFPRHLNVVSLITPEQ